MSTLYEQAQQLVNKEYTFDDGDKITVIEANWRSEDEVFVHVRIQQGPGIPRVLRLNFGEFLDYYGHLFRDELRQRETKKHYIDDSNL